MNREPSHIGCARAPHPDAARLMRGGTDPQAPARPLPGLIPLPHEHARDRANARGLSHLSVQTGYLLGVRWGRTELPARERVPGKRDVGGSEIRVLARIVPPVVAFANEGMEERSLRRKRMGPVSPAPKTLVFVGSARVFVWFALTKASALSHIPPQGPGLAPCESCREPYLFFIDDHLGLGVFAPRLLAQDRIASVSASGCLSSGVRLSSGFLPA